MVGGTATSAVAGGIFEYIDLKITPPNFRSAQNKSEIIIRNDIIDLPRTRSALKLDPYHAFPNIVDNYANGAYQYPINNATLYQIPGSLNGKEGRFEWIVQNQQITHRLFVEGGINGVPNKP